MTAARHAGVDRRTAAFRWPVRVYWEDTDAAGIVFYANYLKFFERARTEWLRSLGFEQEVLRVETGARLRRHRHRGALPRAGAPRRRDRGQRRTSPMSAWRA